MNRFNQAGFSLPELIIVVTLTGVILAATYGVLVTNQRTYTVQNAQIQSQQTVRAAMEILTTELREVSSNGGDLVTLGDHSLRAKTLRKLGIICSATNPLGSRIYVRPLGEEFTNTDSLFIFADNNRNLWADDVWLETHITGVTSHTCDDDSEGQDVNVDLTTALLQDELVLIGASVRSFATYDYYVDTWDEDGHWYLFRERGGVAQPLVGPLRGADGVRFEYLDEDENEATTSADVAQIRVTVATLSPIRQADGSRLRDSLVAVVHTRN